LEQVGCDQCDIVAMLPSHAFRRGGKRGERWSNDEPRRLLDLEGIDQILWVKRPATLQRAGEVPAIPDGPDGA
jgi:hypothetical protein